MKMNRRWMKRVCSMLMALAMIISMVPATVFAASTDTKVFLKPNSNWKVDNARFAIYCFGNGEKWVSMSDSDGDGIYEGTVPAGFPSLIFCRMNPSTTANNWNNKWNQTADLTLPTNDNNCYAVKEGTWDNGGGTWSHIHVYTAVVTAPDCTNGGYTTHTCVCGKDGYEDSNTSPIGHSWSNGVCGTCSEECKHEKYTDGVCNTCKIICKHSYTNGVCGTCGAVCEHSYVDGICGVCGAEDPNYVPPACPHEAHNTEGVCTACGETVGHNYTSKVTAPDCTNGGYTTYTCPVCSHSYIGNETPKAGHSWKDGVCGTCGAVCEHTYTDGVCGTCGMKGPVTVYFRNDWVWPEVYVYYWDNPSGQKIEWPGEKMTKVDTDSGYDVYAAQIPGWATGLLFNGLENTNPSNRQQTPDVTGFADGDAYYIHWDRENKVSKFTYNPAGGEEPDPSTPADPVEATYIIAGTGELCGTAWDIENTANTMKLNAETGLYEKTYESVAAGTHKFKVTDGTWNNAWGNSDDTDGNTVFTLDAISNVTITFNADTKEIAVTSEATGEVAESVEYFTIHYRNTGLWGEVAAYGWYAGTETTVLGGWPGTKISEEADHKNWYTVELNDLAENAGIGILFNNNNNGSQTADIMIEESGEYWYDGALLTEAPATWDDGSVEMVPYSVTLHFANAKNWGSVNLYTWNAAGMPTGSWPGTAAGLDEDGFYTLSFTYEAPEGQGLNFIFSGGGQTVDLALEANAFTEDENGVWTAEKWVVPTTQDTEGKYYADIVDDSEAVAISPVVNGNSVTFEYKDAGATSVTVAGSFNGWNKTANPMTKNAYGVWSTTVDVSDYGIHQYKFIVDGKDPWHIDPLNSWVVTEANGNQNSAFLISNPDSDTNVITIKVHFNAPTSEWNICAWGAPDLKKQYDFTDGVATIELGGRAAQYVAFKVRKSIEGNDWAEQSGEIRVDLAGIVSGTIDVWVGNDFSVSQTLNDDVVYANKVSSVELDYDKNTITIKTGKNVSNPETAFAIYKNGQKADIIEAISASGSAYTLTLKEELDLVTLYQYKVRFSEQKKFDEYEYSIGINTVYASDKFAEEFTYNGKDLGANWTAASTKFVVWAPTAAAVSVNRYTSGTEKTEDLIESVKMTRGEKGVWTATVEGDLNGTYYTYLVNVNGKDAEAVDPYARTTGVNGKRGMVINLDSTDPAGWANDKNPNPISSYTDAVIYELHVRDFSIDDSSGVSAANRGKYLAFTEKGTTTANGVSTGIDYLDDLGITHLHLLPVYDYGSVDETTCSNFNWGYDPVNYNTPEGSYSTNPDNGATRVNEFKQMVKALHDADISVIMDVVYNHVYDAGEFCMNKIVPNYFSRVNPDGSFSNGSGCGNDTASEREMVRKYIVESVLYWHQEYHIDGFRFDLVGLLDATTINQIVDEVHKCCPDVIFYGEGWTMGTAVEPGNTMATQANSGATPNFAYFSDTIRNLLAGSNGTSLGFASGLTGQEEAIRDNFMASPWWSKNPRQIVQYASCHDNYTLVDKLVLSTGKSGIDDEIIKMNNLAAAIYMTSQGIPFIHAGEEFLREKLDATSHTGRCENSYNAPDSVNHIEWSNLENGEYAENSEYYKGLIEFRKAHKALRMTSNAAIKENITYTWIDNEVVMFTIDGKAAGDISDSIVVIFNATKDAKTVNLPSGEWSICIDNDDAGTEVVRTASGHVSVAGISAMVLVQGENAPDHVHDWENGTCDGCGEVCTHTFDGDTCTNCGFICSHNWNDGHCDICYTDCGHDWDSATGECTICDMVCDHAVHWQNGLCSNCYADVEHVYNPDNGMCSCGKSSCEHTTHNVNGMCNDCGLAVGHNIGADGICSVCTYNQNLIAFLAGTMNGWNASGNALQSIGGTKVAGSVYLQTGEYEFKIVYKNDWYGNGGTIDGATSVPWVMDSGSNCKLNAKHDGMYTFVYDTATNKLEVYNRITETLYLRGSFNEWSTENAMSGSGTNVQKATVLLDAGSYKFKVANDDWSFGQPASDIEITLNQKAELTVTATYNGDGTWTVTYETVVPNVVQNSNTGASYATLEEALEAAESGDTIILQDDCEAGEVVLNPGVTLDLNGHTLSAESVFGVDTSGISDSSNNAQNNYEPKGLLLMEKGNLFLPEDNGAVPVYNPEKGGYIFVDFLFQSKVVGNTINLLTTSRTMETIELLKNGAEDNDVKVVVRVSWNGEDGRTHKDFKFNDETVQRVMQSNRGKFNDFGRMFYVTVSGLENLTGVTAQVMIISESNAADSGLTHDMK